MTPRPPKTARRLLRVTLAAADRDDVLANLDELYHARRARGGSVFAYIWYWTQALSFSPRLRVASRRAARDQISPPPPPPPPPPSRSADIVIQIWEDVRFAVRSFLKAPAFSLAAIGTLALGFGANAVIYAVVSAVVLRPLPFPDAERLVWVWSSGQQVLTLSQFTELQPEAQQFADLTAFAGRRYAITGGDTPDEVTGVGVTTNHFDVFGTHPQLGRGLQAQDGAPGTEPVAVISYELWQSHFAGDPSVVGQRVDLFTAAVIPMVPGAFTGTPHTVVGVLPPRYRPFGFQAEVYTPLVVNPADPNFRNMGELSVVGRLTQHANAEQLRAELVQLSRVLPSLRNSQEQIAQEQVVGLQHALVGQLRPAMLATLGAVGLVLLIACANVANLALARIQTRRQELALRYALGASRWRIARQLMTENTVLAAIAAVVGLVGARVMLPTVVRSLPHEITAADSVSLDASVLTFCFAALIVTSLLSGTLPAVRNTKRLEIRQIGAGAGAGAGAQRGAGSSIHIISKGLVVGEIALALVLAYGAALLLKSFTNLTDVDAGFSAENVMTVRVAPSERRFRDSDTRRALYAQILENVRGISGVQSAGAIHFLPMADGGPGINFLVDPTDPQTRASASYRVITPGYLASLRIPVLQGRPIEEGDRPGAAPVGLVNRAFAQQLWPDGDAMGKTLYRTNGRQFFSVIGVVGDVRQSALGLPPRAEIYLPLAQSEWASAMTIVARTSREVPEMSARLRAIVRSADPNLPITRLASMESILSGSLASPRFYGVMFALFAALALVLGGIGVYGVVSFAVGNRKDEIGIRMALGATRSGIMGREIGHGAVMTGTGIGVGLLAAFSSSRLLSSLLFEVSPFDPGLFVATTVIIAAIALLGVAVPARRASRVDPMVAIRAAD